MLINRLYNSFLTTRSKRLCIQPARGMPAISGPPSVVMNPHVKLFHGFILFAVLMGGPMLGSYLIPIHRNKLNPPVATELEYEEDEDEDED